MAGIELKKFVVYLTKLSLAQTVRVRGRIIIEYGSTKDISKKSWPSLR
jgi:hypothetical protein